eukprot:COSAG02_NODE_38008_length_434_cov_1.632836_1_plen_127_part_01
MPFNMAVLVVDNDVSFADESVWQLETLATAATPVVRGPFRLDDSFFSSHYGSALLSSEFNSANKVDPQAEDVDAGSESWSSASWTGSEPALWEKGGGSWSDGLAESSWRPAPWLSNSSGFWNAEMPD